LKILGLSDHCPNLKVGAPVTLLRILNQSIGLCNGNRLIVSKMGDRVVDAKEICGPNVGETVLVPELI